jgi:hypothetical protein
MPPPSKGLVGVVSGRLTVVSLCRGMDFDFPVQPPMMSFKQFLANQDDNITDEEAIQRFNEYKQDFKRKQLVEFFEAHKDEEW